MMYLLLSLIIVYFNMFVVKILWVRYRKKVDILKENVIRVSVRVVIVWGICFFIFFLCVFVILFFILCYYGVYVKMIRFLFDF